MIGIVDYGMGNLRNVRRACEHTGVRAEVMSDALAIAGAEALILPGVGSFGEAVRRIDALGLRAPIRAHVGAGKPLLGICLGMQLLFEESEESPGAAGLGIFKGGVKKFRGGVKIPHIGWNDVRPAKGAILFGEQEKGDVFYFVHSFYAGLLPETIAVTTYGEEFSAAVRRENVFGVQFHPEKSQEAGLNLLRRFASWPATPGMGIT